MTLKIIKNQNKKRQKNPTLSGFAGERKLLVALKIIKKSEQKRQKKPIIIELCG